MIYKLCFKSFSLASWCSIKSLTKTNEWESADIVFVHFDIVQEANKFCKTK